MVTLGTMAGTVYLYVVIPKGFFPVEDTGFISVTVEGPADISFRAMRERQGADRRDDPAGSGRRTIVNSTVGVGGPNATNNTGRMFVGLKPKSERGPRAPVLQRLRRTTASVVGMAVYFREIQNINLGGRISKGEFQYTMQSSETETLYRVSDEMLEKDQDDPGPARRQQRPLHQEPGDRDRDRPREGGVLRHLGRSDPPGALQRVRQPAGRDDLHADQRLPDHPGDAARLPGRRHRPVEDLSQDQPRQHVRPRSTIGGGVLGTGTPNGMSIPLSAVTQAGAERSGRCRSTIRASSRR